MNQRLLRNPVLAALLLAGAPSALAQSLFDDPVELSLSLAESGREFTTVDIDHDGDLDVLIVDRLGSFSDVITLRNDGGSFVQQTSLSALPSSSRFVFTDANNDAMADIVEGSSAGASVRLSTGNLSFAPPVVFQGPTSFLLLRDTLDFGTPGVNSTDLELFASALPANQFGMFVGSTDLTLGTQPASSSGFLCLTGSIGRYDSPGQIGSTGPGGTLRLPLDPGALETSMGQVPAVAGATWGFQAWHRDLTDQGIPTSNFTGAVVITFQP